MNDRATKPNPALLPMSASTSRRERLPENLQLIYWIPTVGTWAQVLFGYCAMARMVSLLPWNRKEALSFDYIKRTFVSAPVRGNILQGLPPA